MADTACASLGLKPSLLPPCWHRTCASFSQRPGKHEAVQCMATASQAPVQALLTAGQVPGPAQQALRTGYRLCISDPPFSSGPVFLGPCQDPRRQGSKLDLSCCVSAGVASAGTDSSPSKRGKADQAGMSWAAGSAGDQTTGTPRRKKAGKDPNRVTLAMRQAKLTGAFTQVRVHDAALVGCSSQGFEVTPAMR